MQETIITPNKIRMMQESYQKLMNPFMEQANFILAHSIPRYLLTDKGIKAIYPYQTLKSLTLIRIGARQTCIAHFGLEFYNKYIHNNDGSMNKTLYDLQAGDEVLVVTSYSEAVVKVERTTKNYIVIGRSKYRKSDGILVGGDIWRREYIRISTPDDIQRIKEKHWHDRLVKLVSNIPFQSLTNDQLQSILNIVKQNQV